jgi:hypothetical protein
MPNFGVIGCVGPAAGRRTYTHTYTLSSLYYRLQNVQLKVIPVVSVSTIKLFQIYFP